MPLNFAKYHPVVIIICLGTPAHTRLHNTALIRDLSAATFLSVGWSPVKSVVKGSY